MWLSIIQGKGLGLDVFPMVTYLGLKLFHILKVPDRRTGQNKGAEKEDYFQDQRVEFYGSIYNIENESIENEKGIRSDASLTGQKSSDLIIQVENLRMPF